MMRPVTSRICSYILFGRRGCPLDLDVTSQGTVGRLGNTKKQAWKSLKLKKPDIPSTIPSLPDLLSTVGSGLSSPVGLRKLKTLTLYKNPLLACEKGKFKKPLNENIVRIVLMMFIKDIS
ncbi:hypothetical protein M9H77_23262 [Catharanthus roseus]|uniref:Uncharacterized protein n=1 Tax=Catharanthus roseus TaxID=4058 RepID=A0ACC0AST6_CATRO|nr:hypothetical protein M9H77_23262 [Catharanthus roseus]